MIWWRDVFVSQGNKAEHAINCETGRNNFIFDNTILEVIENEFADPIFMLTKIGQCMKSYSLIGHKLLTDTCISIEKLDTIDAGGPDKESLDTHYSRLRKMHSQVCPDLLDETNGCLLIDDTPLTPTSQNIMLSCVKGLFYFFHTREVFRCQLMKLLNWAYFICVTFLIRIFWTLLRLQWCTQRTSTHFWLSI